MKAHLFRLATVLFTGTLITALGGGLHGTAQAQQPLTLEALRNGTYPSMAADRDVTLANGRFVQSSPLRIQTDFVDAAIAPAGAAVILATNTGGSGVFHELFVLDAQSRTVASAAIGDRIRVGSTAFDGTRVTIVATVHGPSDPLCCATLRVSDTYEQQGRAMVRVARQQLPPETTPRPPATGSAGTIASPAAPTLVAQVLIVLAVLAVSSLARHVGRAAQPHVAGRRAGDAPQTHRR